MLLSYLLPGSLGELRGLFLDWVVIASAAALLVGVLNLISVHLAKMRARQGASLYSFILVSALIVTFFITLLDRPGGFDPQWLVAYIQVPVETSLMAVLTVTLTYAAAQLLSRRTNAYSAIFGLAALAALVSLSPLLGMDFPWIKVIASAGGRGILIGVGLGTVATGLRILMGSDRPYGG